MGAWTLVFQVQCLQLPPYGAPHISLSIYIYRYMYKYYICTYIDREIQKQIYGSIYTYTHICVYLYIETFATPPIDLGFWVCCQK